MNRLFQRLGKRSGQSLVEYLVITAAILLALVALNGQGLFQGMADRLMGKVHGQLNAPSATADMLQ